MKKKTNGEAHYLYSNFCVNKCVCFDRVKENEISIILRNIVKLINEIYVSDYPYREQFLTCFPFDLINIHIYRIIYRSILFVWKSLCQCLIRNDPKLSLIPIIVHHES